MQDVDIMKRNTHLNTTSFTTQFHRTPPHSPHYPSLDLDELESKYEPSHYVYESAASLASRRIIETASYQTTPSTTPPLSSTPTPPTTPSVLLPHSFHILASKLQSYNNRNRDCTRVRLPVQLQGVCGPEEDTEEALLLDRSRKLTNETHNTSSQMRRKMGEKGGRHEVAEERERLRESGGILVSEKDGIGISVKLYGPEASDFQDTGKKPL